MNQHFVADPFLDEYMGGFLDYLEEEEDPPLTEELIRQGCLTMFTRIKSLKRLRIIGQEIGR
jgi:hypothetical protein